MRPGANPTRCLPSPASSGSPSPCLPDRPLPESRQVLMIRTGANRRGRKMNPEKLEEENMSTCLDDIGKEEARLFILHLKARPGRGHRPGQRGGPPVHPSPGAGPEWPAESAWHWLSGDGRRRRRRCGQGGYVITSERCSLFLAGILIKNHYPRFRGAPFSRLQLTSDLHLFGEFRLPGAVRVPRR